MPGTLVVRRGVKVIGRFPLGKRDIVLGRGGNIVLDSATVSTKHAMITPAAGRHDLLSDLGSKNGTLVNGVRLKPGEQHAIQHGDEIQVEEFVIRCILSAIGDEADFSAFTSVALDPLTETAGKAPPLGPHPADPARRTAVLPAFELPEETAAPPRTPPTASAKALVAAPKPPVPPAAAVRRSTKALQARIEPTYYLEVHPFRRWLRRAGLASAGAALLSIAAVHAASLSRVYSSGPVSSAHAVFGSECAACHTRSFAPTADTACLKCHEGLLTPQDSASFRALAAAGSGPTATADAARRLHGARFPTHRSNETFTPECTTCHVEHKGFARLTDNQTEQHCTRCHAGLEALNGLTRIGPDAAKVPAFARGHPEVAPLTGKTAFPAGSSGLLAPGGRDAARVFTDHAVHMAPRLASMDAKGRAEWIARTGRDHMLCADCHEPDESRRYMRPVRFERHCGACHVLDATVALVEKSDRFTKTVAIPHGYDPQDIRAVVGFLEIDREVKRFYEDYARRFPAEAPAGWVAERMKAFAAPVMKRVRGEMVPDKLGGTREVERALVKTCIRCHYLSGEGFAIDPAGLLAADIRARHEERVDAAWQAAVKKGESPPAPGLLPTKVPARWLGHSKFDHEAHRALRCTECHAKARESKETADVMLPAIATCQACHKPGGARDRCMECHSYHDERAQRSFEGELRIERLIGGGK